jgi:hypothetical protein
MVDWHDLGLRLQPILNSLTEELVKAQVSKTRIWISFLAGLLPQPIGAIPSVIDLIEAYAKKSLAPAMVKIRKSQEKLNRERKAG